MDKYTLKDYYLWKLEGDKVYVLDVEGQIAGVIDIIEGKDYVLVDMLAKNKLVNAEKVGTTLLKFSEEYAESRGKSYVILEALDTSIGFYKKFGYQEIGKKVDKEWGVLTVMLKKLQKKTEVKDRVLINEKLAIL